jgi:uncharacterized membrane protein YidH (DUF202 family)
MVMKFICYSANFLADELRYLTINSWKMKLISKNILSGFQVNPIHRDLIMVVSVGLVIAMAIVTLLVMILSQI